MILWVLSLSALAWALPPIEEAFVNKLLESCQLLPDCKTAYSIEGTPPITDEQKDIFTYYVLYALDNISEGSNSVHDVLETILLSNATVQDQLLVAYLLRSVPPCQANEVFDFSISKCACDAGKICDGSLAQSRALDQFWFYVLICTGLIGNLILLVIVLREVYNMKKKILKS
jgi:hypothetical protein